jgi:hypothetical protein
MKIGRQIIDRKNRYWLTNKPGNRQTGRKTDGTTEIQADK